MAKLNRTKLRLPKYVHAAATALSEEERSFVDTRLFPWDKSLVRIATELRAADVFSTSE